MSDDEGTKVSTGRFSRLAKLASLSARLSGELVSRGVRRLAGDEATSLLGSAAAEKVVATLGDLKGLAMKVGQAMSMDPEFLTPEVRAVVAKLQNQAPPMPFSTVKAVVESELGRPLGEAYSRFEEHAVASASLGQVHRAVTHQGLPVAVKVQYPDIAEALHADLDNIRSMVDVMGASSGMPQSRAYYGEMRQAFLDELDYRLEAERAQLFVSRIEAFEDLRAPHVLMELTSGKVLTMEFLEGEPLRSVLHHKEGLSNERRFALARQLIRAVWGPFLRSGLVHADPHPGNFLAMPDGRLGILDFGAVKQMSERWTTGTVEMTRTLVEGRTVDAFAACQRNGFELDDENEARPFVQEVVAIATRPLTAPFFDYGQAGTSRLMRQHFLKHALTLKRMRPPREALQFFRAVGGLSQNLENLGAAGPYRRVWEELLGAA